MRLAEIRVDVGGNRNVNTRSLQQKHRPKKSAHVLVRGIHAIGGATTQQTTSIVWTPDDAVAFAQQTDQLWQALNAAAVQSSGVGTSGTTQAAGTQLTGQTIVKFINDYEEWSAFYAGAQNSVFSSATLWWNTDTISAFQGKAAGWYNTIQTLNPSATLPQLSPAAPGTLAWFPSKGTVLWGAGLAAAGGVLWFAWPWLTRARKKNPRRRR